MNILVTGAAGFIGFHTALALLRRGDAVTGLDNLNAYYDPALKEARVAELHKAAAAAGAAFTFQRLDLSDAAALRARLERGGFDRVIHLAAQAGVRHSIDHPEEYVASNLVGFANMLEACRAVAAPHLTFASTSSVYGANTRLPYSEHQGADHPLQFYAATKRANELMAHSYANLFDLPMTGLRFFTVYGPWGRPDMALFKFTKAILTGERIEVYNYGEHTRDFTYVDDIVKGVIAASDTPAAPNPHWSSEDPDPATSSAPYRIFNIGNSTPVKLIDYIKAIEASVGKKARIELLPLQPGDLPDTLADVTHLESVTGYRPATSVEWGVARFVEWYRGYYGV